MRLLLESGASLLSQVKFYSRHNPFIFLVITRNTQMTTVRFENVTYPEYMLHYLVLNDWDNFYCNSIDLTVQKYVDAHVIHIHLFSWYAGNAENPFGHVTFSDSCWHMTENERSLSIMSYACFGFTMSNLFLFQEIKSNKTVLHLAVKEGNIRLVNFFLNLQLSDMQAFINMKVTHAETSLSA